MSSSEDDNVGGDEDGGSYKSSEGDDVSGDGSSCGEDQAADEDERMKCKWMKGGLLQPAQPLPPNWVWRGRRPTCQQAMPALARSAATVPTETARTARTEAVAAATSSARAATIGPLPAAAIPVMRSVQKLYSHYFQQNAEGESGHHWWHRFRPGHFR